MLYRRVCVCVCVFMFNCSRFTSVHHCCQRVLLSAHSNINMITNAINSAIAYINVSRRVHTGTVAMATLITSQVTALKSAINQAPYDMADATTAIETIGGAPFENEHRDALVACIHAKTQKGVVAGGGSAHNSAAGQTHRYIFNYMTASVWDKQGDRNCTEMDRAIDMVGLCHKIGLYFPDVTSRKLIVATMMLAHGTSPSPRGAKALYDMVATINNDRRPLKKYAATPMSTYPENSATFIEVHPTLYATDDQPVPSRLTKLDVNGLAASIPVRNTSNLLKHPDASSMSLMRLPTIGMPSSSSNASMMMNMFMNMMQSQQRNGGADAHDSELPLTMLRRRGPMSLTDSVPQHAESALIGGRVPSLAAIADGSSQHTATDSASPADASHDTSITAGIATPIGGSGVETDIDRMLNDGALALQPPKKKQKLATAAAAVMKKPARATAVAIFDRSSPPKFGTQCPCVFNKCKIYEVSTKFRVVPAPDRSAYDKAFPFNAASKKTAWASLIKYCLKPSIPKDSKNYVKL